LFEGFAFGYEKSGTPKDGQPMASVFSKVNNPCGHVSAPDQGFSVEMEAHFSAWER
jgi:hypothetical protein